MSYCAGVSWIVYATNGGPYTVDWGVEPQAGASTWLGSFAASVKAGSWTAAPDGAVAFVGYFDAAPTVDYGFLAVQPGCGFSGTPADADIFAACMLIFAAGLAALAGIWGTRKVFEVLAHSRGES